MRYLLLQLFLIVGCIAIHTNDVTGQSDRRRYFIGIGIKPVKSASADFNLFLSDRFALNDTILAPVFSRKRYVNTGFSIGAIYQNWENNLQKQIHVEVDLGERGHHYVAAGLGLGRKFSKKHFNISPCLNILAGYMHYNLAEVNAKNLYILAGDRLFDQNQTINLKKTSMLWGISPNISLATEIDQNTEVFLTLGYLASFQSHHNLVFTGKDKDRKSVKAKVKIDEQEMVEVGSKDSISQIKSMVKLQGFYCKIGIVLF